ncbi:MAG: LysE family transporter [Sneathiella sp.]
MTPAFFSLISLIFLAAITPGPNNFIVLGLSANRGRATILLPIIAILSGTQFVLLLTNFGFEAAFSAVTWLRPLMIIGGCCFLFWASVKMIFGTKSDFAHPTQNFTLIGLFFFQILNPKTWILVGTSYAAFTAIDTSDDSNRLYLSVLILAITAPCLFLWALFGRLLKSQLSSDFTGKYLQTGLGIAMMMSIIGLMTVV